MASSAPETVAPRLRELAGLFLKLGATAFGGPAAHVAMLEDEVVRRRRWLTHAEFLDLLGATHLIPGPNSTELAIHIGLRRAGWRGWLVAGSCFILPAMVLVLGVAWVYVEFGSLPEASAVLYGIKPVIMAVVAQALWALGRTAIRSRFLFWVAVAGATLNLAGFHELLVLFGLGGVSALAAQPWRTRLSLQVGAGGLLWPWAATSGAGAAASAVPFSLSGLFLFFLKVGAVLYGSGYVLLAFLRADLVERWGWLTESQLLDAVAVGQITPGPLFTTATFIGYILGGVPGAILGTLGIFLPAFLFVAVSGPLIPRLRKSPVMSGFLDGVNAAALALMGVVTWQLGSAALVDAVTMGLAMLSAVLLIRFRVNSAWLVGGGAVVGLLASRF